MDCVKIHICAVYVMLVVVSAVAGDAIDNYYVPLAEVKVFSPRGFEVSIPDNDGINLFAFHGKVNNELQNLEAGDMSVDIHVKSKNGRWTYVNDDIELKIGDVIYYWLYILKDKLGYLRTNQSFYVKGYSSRNATNIKPTPHSEYEGNTIPPPEDLDSKTSLQSCLKVVDNTIESLKEAQSEIRRLNEKCSRLDETEVDAAIATFSSGLILGGALPKIVDYASQSLVNFVLWEKLLLTQLESRQSFKRPDGTIVFDMFTPSEKTEVMQAAKKYLKDSTIYIKDANH